MTGRHRGQDQAVSRAQAVSAEAPGPSGLLWEVDSKPLTSLTSRGPVGVSGEGALPGLELRAQQVLLPHPSPLHRIQSLRAVGAAFAGPKSTTATPPAAAHGGALQAQPTTPHPLTKWKLF